MESAGYRGGPNGAYYGNSNGGYERATSTNPPLPRSMTTEERKPNEALNYSAARPTAQGASQGQSGPNIKILRRAEDFIGSTQETARE